MLHPLVLYTLAVAAGIAALVWGAERFVIGAASTAFNLGVAPLIIGLTIVALGTSAPEILVALTSSLKDQAGLAVGNAIGSNIANIALILAATALVVPVAVKAGIVSRELPLLMLVTFAGIALLWDRRLDRIDGVLLAAGLVAVLAWIIRYARRRPLEEVKKEFNIDLPPTMSTPRALALLVFSIAVLIVSSRVLVWGAVELAQYFGVSDVVIGLTIVAIGTSLPELAASIASALKGQYELVLGNLIGSNIFNTLAVLSVPALLGPSVIEPAVLTRDVPVMTLLTLALFATAYPLNSRPARINRVEGGLLLTAYAGYMSAVYLSVA